MVGEDLELKRGLEDRLLEGGGLGIITVPIFLSHSVFAHLSLL